MAHGRDEHSFGDTRYSRQMRILFVEDNLNTGMAMKVLLEMKGHAVDHVTTVAAALEKLGSGAYDLMISDLSLPDGTGYDILARHPLRAIALSGHTSEQDRSNALEHGFREYLTKPFK